MKTALLIIDVQHVLCTGKYAAFEVDRVINTINTVSAKAREAGVAVVVIQHEEGETLQHGTPSWQLAHGLVVQPGDLLLRKTASDSFHKTELQALLQERGITRLVVCGLQSDFCVDTTTRRALALGYPVVLVQDGHSTLDNGVLSAAQIVAHHNLTLSNLSSFGPRVSLVPAAQVQFVAADQRPASHPRMHHTTTTTRLATATPHDISAVATLFDAYRQFYEQAPNRALAEQFIASRLQNAESVILVAEDAARNMTGFCQLYPTFCSVDAMPIYSLYDLFVVPEHRKTGAGRQLLLAAEEQARQHGKSRMDLTTAKTNLPAQALYESLGWKRDEVFYAYSKRSDHARHKGHGRG